MQVKGSFQVKAPIEKVWGSLWDPATMAMWVPGCTSATVEGERIKAVVEQSVAFLKSRFDLDLAVLERQDPNKVIIEGSGKDSRIASQVKLRMVLDMADAGGTATDVNYDAEVQVFGRIATIGHFVIQAKAKDLEKDFQAKVKRVLEG